MVQSQTDWMPCHTGLGALDGLTEKFGFGCMSDMQYVGGSPTTISNGKSMSCMQEWGTDSICLRNSWFIRERAKIKISFQIDQVVRLNHDNPNDWNWNIKSIPIPIEIIWGPIRWINLNLSSRIRRKGVGQLPKLAFALGG